MMVQLIKYLIIIKIYVLMIYYNIYEDIRYMNKINNYVKIYQNYYLILGYILEILL